MLVVRLSPLVLAFGLSGCFVPIIVPAPPGAPGSITYQTADPCGARSVSRFRGQPEVAVTGNRFDAPGPVRVLRIGEPATSDFIENRLNFVIGADGTVADIRCG